MHVHKQGVWDSGICPVIEVSSFQGVLRLRRWIYEHRRRCIPGPISECLEDMSRRCFAGAEVRFLTE